MLTLDRNRLSKLPHEFMIPDSLRCLSVTHNNLIAFVLRKPAKRLVELKINDNSLRDFSLQAPKLRKLSLERNELTEIPLCIKNLLELTYLNISNNPITEPFSSSITLLEYLEELDISFVSLECQRDYISDSIFMIESLTSLSLRHTFTDSSILSSISNLKNLISLDLSENELCFIPPPVFQLHQLEELKLISNNLEILPTTMTLFVKLKSLDVSNNKITCFDYSVREIGYLYETESFIFNNNPLDDKYKLNGVYPTPHMIFQHLNPDITEVQGEDLIPILSLFFVGPSGAGKGKLITSFFPELKENSSESKIKSTINHTPGTVQLYPIITHEINDTPFYLRIRKFSGHGKKNIKYLLDLN